MLQHFLLLHTSPIESVLNPNMYGIVWTVFQECGTTTNVTWPTWFTLQKIGPGSLDHNGIQSLISAEFFQWTTLVLPHANTTKNMKTYRDSRSHHTPKQDFTCVSNFHLELPRNHTAVKPEQHSTVAVPSDHQVVSAIWQKDDELGRII